MFLSAILKTPICFWRQRKKIDLFFLTAVKNPPAFSYRWKIKLLLRKRRIFTAAETTFRNNVLLRNFQNQRLKTSQPKTPSLVKIDSFFIAGTHFKKKHPTKKIRHRHFVEEKCLPNWNPNFVKIRRFIMTLSGFPSKLRLSTDTTYS